MRPGAIHAAVLETGARKLRAQGRPGPSPHLRARSPESAPLKDFGGKLYGVVFQDELRDALQRSLTLTRAQQARMRLRLADTPELAELPWEFLYDPRRGPVPGPIAPRRSHTGQLTSYQR
jgi:hypothetical protein